MKKLHTELFSTHTALTGGWWYVCACWNLIQRFTKHRKDDQTSHCKLKRLHMLVNTFAFSPPSFTFRRKKIRGFCCRSRSPNDHMPQSSMKYSDTSTQMEIISFSIIVQFSHSINTIFLYRGFIVVFPTTSFSKHNMLCLLGMSFLIVSKLEH